MSWRPIDTAPRDGRQLLLFRADFVPSVFVGHFAWTDLPRDHGDYWEGFVFSEDLLASYSDIDPEPSHWMAIPEPPDGIYQDAAAIRGEA